jgi:hypothetical protein
MQDQDALLALGILGRLGAGFLGIHVRKFAANRSNLSRFAGVILKSQFGRSAD